MNSIFYNTEPVIFYNDYELKPNTYCNNDFLESKMTYCIESIVPNPTYNETKLSYLDDVLYSIDKQFDTTYHKPLDDNNYNKLSYAEHKLSYLDDTTYNKLYYTEPKHLHTYDEHYPMKGGEIINRKNVQKVDIKKFASVNYFNNYIVKYSKATGKDNILKQYIIDTLKTV